MANLLKLGISIGASLSSGFTSAITNARTSLTKMGDAAKRIGETKLVTTEFTKLSKAAGENAASFFTVGSTVRKVSGDVRSLDKDSQSLGNTFQKLKKQKADLDKEMKSNRDALKEAKGSYLGIAASMYGAWRVAKGLITSSSDVAKAQGEIGSLGISESGIQSITKVGRAFSNMWAGTGTADFVHASYAIKSGMSSLSDAAVGEYTRIAALTASATLSTTDEMTNLFSKGFGIYRNQFDKFGESVIAGWKKMSAEEQDIEFGKYFSAGISATVQAFRTKGSEMSASLSTLGKDATTAGISFAQQLAILGTLQRTMGGEQAATKFKAFLRTAGNAGQALRLDFIDHQTGMLKSIPDILDQIRRRFGGVIDEKTLQKMDKAFGDTEAAAFVKALIEDSAALRSGFADIEKSLAGGLSLVERMARAMQRGKGFELLGQQLVNMSAILGDVLSPAAMLLGGALSKIATSIQWLGERFPRLTGLCFGLAGGLIAVTLASKAAGVGMAWMRVGMDNLAKLAPGTAATIVGSYKGLGVTLSGVFSSIGASIGSLSLGAIIGFIGIGAVIVGVGIAIWKYWKQTSTFFKGFWTGLKQGLAPVADALSTAFAPLKPILGVMGDLFRSLFTQSNPGADALKHIFEVGVTWGKTFGTVLAANLATLIAFIGEIVSGLKLLFSLGVNFTAGNFKGMGQAFGDFWNESKANGSSAWAAWKTAIEANPSFFAHLPLNAFAGGVGTASIPTFQPRSSAAANMTNVNAPITINTYPGMDAQAIAVEVERKLRERESQAAARSRGAHHD